MKGWANQRKAARRRSTKPREKTRNGVVFSQREQEEMGHASLWKVGKERLALATLVLHRGWGLTRDKSRGETKLEKSSWTFPGGSAKLNIN